MKYRLNENTAVYAANNLTSPIVAELQAGDEVEVGGISTNGTERFHDVTLSDGRTGFISAETKGSKVVPKPESPYKGYGGWLEFFCIVNIFIAPALVAFALISSVSAIKEVASQYPGYWLVAITEWVGRLCVAGFGMYAGSKLRRLDKGAVRIVKFYLLAALLCAFLVVALPSLASDLPSQVSGAMRSQALSDAFRSLVAIAIWNSYFNKSKRIKATFPEG